MRRNKTLLLIALLIAVALPAAAPADERGGEGRSSRRMLEGLNLTAEQEAKFREINSRYGPARRESSQRIEELRERINVELLRDKPARGLLIQYAGQIGEIQKKMSLASVDHMLSVKAVLTPEQFKKFTAMAAQSGGRRDGARGERGERGERGGRGGGAENDDGE